jgi:neural cell adhesion molecule
LAPTGGNVTKNGHITVEFPPSFALTPMREAWTWNNHIVNLTCRAESIPNATITWFYQERNLENDRNVQIYTFNGESTLTVSSNNNSLEIKDGKLRRFST